METVKIKHHSLALDWDKTIKIENPKTIVLGSFNPYEDVKKAVDYYYGRQSNHFWRSIAIINKLDEMWFFDAKEGLERKKRIMNNSFICFDVIESIDISCTDKMDLKNYINQNIYNNFLDSKIWTSQTKSNHNESVSLKRNYNQNVLDYLKENNSIRKIIHTMGVNRLSYKKAKPKEKNLNDRGFEGYMKKIFEICESKKIEFVYESLSPSDYAVKSGKVDRLDLQNFFMNNISFAV